MFFRDIIGQEKVKQRLIQSVKAGFIPHSRLISGPEGVGKMPLAIAYARYLNCTDRQDNDACGTCSSCIKINKLAHPDLHFVFPIVKSDKVCNDYLSEWRDFLSSTTYFNLNNWLSFIEAENAQGMIYTKESDEIIKKLNLKTYEAEYKIMIIWLPEKMHETCANKLLKMIEEPPEKTIFLLVSETPDRVISTIQSRSQQLYIPPIAPNDMEKAISEKYNLPPDDIRSTVHLSDGNFIKALETINTSEEKESFLELFITIMRNSWTRDVKNMKLKADLFASMGREKQKLFLVFAQRLIRENFLYRLNLPEINYMNRKETDFSVKFSTYVNERNVIPFMEELALGEKHIEQNVNPKMVFFDLSMKIAVLLKK